MEERIGEKLSPFVNNLVNDFLGLVLSNVQLTGRRLDSVASVRNMVNARSNFRDTCTVNTK
jgi:hypothetical protein